MFYLYFFIIFVKLYNVLFVPYMLYLKNKIL